MNILFLIFHGLESASGISKKILNQIEGLRQSGHHVSLCHYEVSPTGERMRMVDDQLLENYGSSPWAPVRKRISYGAVTDYARRHHTDLVYVRSFHNANPFTIRLFSQLRKAGIKVVLEIPTYPYDQEYRHLPLSWKAELAVDKCFRRQLAARTDAIVTFSDAPVIFGQRTIRISNGIDLRQLPVKNSLPPHPDPFHLLGVAEVHYWHGYDRAIAGLGEYYRNSPTRQVYLHIVGGLGEAEKQTFRTLVQRYGIADQVIFHGQQQGETLDALFEKCHFGIGSLGRHRCQIDRIKTLKNREYAARGIPFIYSETDGDFETMPYILKASPDDTPISIPGILEFYDRLPLKPGEIRATVRELTWQNQMQQVLAALFNDSPL